MLYKKEKTPDSDIYIVNGNAIRYFILIMLVLFAAMYFFATFKQNTLSAIAFYLAIILGSLFILALILLWGKMMLAAVKGKKIKRTSETTSFGWGKNNFIIRVEIER